MKVLIIGPPDTPYENGCFIFDMFIPDKYPNVAPNIRVKNTGNVKMNPNLNEDGSICLSILDTYVGDTAKGSEKWIPQISTIYQVLMSIQGQILVEKPWLNGVEHYSTYDDKMSLDYNKGIYGYTMQYAMIDLLDKCQYPEFDEVIKNHFRLKKEEILNTCKKWADMNKTLKSKYKKLKLLLSS